MIVTRPCRSLTSRAHSPDSKHSRSSAGVILVSKSLAPSNANTSIMWYSSRPPACAAGLVVSDGAGRGS
jgi:hypothetical protein